MYHPLARAEYIKAAEWYDSRSAGLGDEFSREVEKVLDEILASPTRFAPIYGKVREAQLNRFSAYVIYFRVLSNAVEVISVFHSSRDPSIWQGRI